MHWKRIVSLCLLIAMLAVCSKPVTPILKLEWSEKLPMGLRAHQALIDRGVVCFSNFGLTIEGLREATSVIVALDLGTKEVLWYIERKPLAYMTNDAGRLYVLTHSRIEAASITDGSILWKTPIMSTDSYYHEVNKLLAVDGWLFLEDHNKLRALNAETGAIAWAISLPAPIDWTIPPAGPLFFDKYRAVAYDRDTLYVRVVEDLSKRDEFQFALIALDAKSGRELWDFPFETPATQGDSPPGGASLPAFGEQAVYFGTFGGVSYALDRDTGEVLWEREVDIDYRPVYIDDRIVTISGYQTVAALDAQTGDLRWTVPFMDDGIGMVSPFIFSNRHLVFYASDGDKGQLSVVDLDSGEIIFKLHPDFPSDCGTLFPVAFAIHGEHLYLVTLNCIHSFQISW